MEGEYRSSKNRSMARDSKAGIVLAIRDEELGVEGKYFPLGGFFASEQQRESIGMVAQV